MTDRAFDTDLTATPHATDNPFLAVTGAVRASQTAPAANDDDSDNPFLKITGRVAPATSATGSFVRGAARGFLPAIGSLPAVGTGAELGAAAGAFGGPFAPVTVPLGAIAGGAIGGIGGSYVISALQNWGLSKLKESWVEALGMSDRQEKLDQEYHGTASFLGGLAPYALTMRPGLAPKTALPPNATALQRVMAHPATAHVFGGGVVGGMELGQEAFHGEPTDWGKVAIATSFGVVFNRPYRIGERLTEVGARPVRRALGVPEPATTPRGEAHEGAPAPPEPAAEAAPTAPQEAPAPAAPQVTGKDFRTEILERTKRGTPYGEPPTIADAADLKVMGPGVTENVFLGSHEQDPSAETTARDTKRVENSVIGPQPAGPDVHAVARRMHPELFEKYDELSSLRDEFRTWITQRNNPSDELIGQATERRDALQAKLDAHVADQNGYTGGAEARRLRAHVRDAQREIDGLQERRTAYAEGRAEQTAELIAARGHLLKAEYGLRDLHGEVQAAYRRAADAIGAGTVPPEPRGEAAAKTEANEPIQPELPHVPAAPPAVPAQGVVEGPAASPKAQEAIPAKAPEPPKPRTIEEQRDFVRRDVTRALIRAGRPKDEAEAAGALMAARYETRAARFQGKRGTAEELYREEAPEILGPGMRSMQGFRTSPPRKPKPPERMSLLEFADHLGGLQRTGDLAHTLDEDFKVGGRKLFRQDGLTEDRFREAASEAGYLVNNKETTGQQASLKELHEAIREEAKGKKRYRFGMEPQERVEAEGREEEAPEAEEALEPHEMAAAAEGDQLGHLSEEDRAALELFQKEELKNDRDLYQTARGSVLFREGQRPIMRLMAEQNASTFIHESGHVFLEELMRDAAHEAAPEQLKADAATTLKWLGINDHADLNTGWKGKRGRRARAAHERFATGFEQYLREGTAPSLGLASVFAKFRNWLLSIYETLKGLGKPINEDIRNVFDRLLAEEPQRTVIAPEREPAKGFSDIHAADAQEIEPSQAEPAASRVAEERLKAYDDHSNEQREIEDALARFYAEHEPAEPAGETSEGAGGPRQVLPGGGPAGTEPAGGGAGAEHGAERTGGSAVAEQGDRLPGAEPGPGNRAQLESLPLAPAPAAEFPAGSSFTIGKAGNVRVENITSVPEFMRAIEESSERIGGGGPITMGEMMDLANEMAIDPSKISEAGLARMFGGVQNLAAKIFALRTAIADSAKIVHGAMAKVRDGGTDADVAEFARVVARHDMMQSVLSSVTSEAGRGLGMGFRNLENWKQAGDLNEFLKANTGRTLFQLKQIAKLGAQLDSPAKVSKFLRDAQKRSFGGMILEYWINGLISGLATHMTYAEGNGILTFWKAVPETLLASGIGAARRAAGRPGERVYAGEAFAGARAIVGGLPASTQAFLEAMRTGQTTLLPGEQARPQTPFQGDTALMIAKSITNDPVTWREVGGQAYALMRGLRDGLISGAALLKAGGEPGAPLLGLHYSPLGQIPDIAVRGVPVLPLGSAIRIPGRGVAAIHSFFRTTNYLREGAAEAYRVASEENRSGNDFFNRVAEVRTNPSPEQMERWRAGATAATLMSDGGVFVKALSQLTNAKVDLPLIGELAPLKFIDPFVHIGANVINQAIVQRTPLGILSAEIRADLAGRNGNIAQDMAAARMLAGTALSLVFGSLAMEGYASGSGPKEGAKAAMWREAGYQPHSIRVGDMWYQVNRLGPMGMLMGVAADMYEVAHEASEGEMMLAAAHLQHAITQNILDESFMRGPADLIKAIEDPGRYGESYLKQFASSFVPFSVGMFQIARASDPYSREARNVMDSITAKIPGKSETLLPRISVWGEPMPNAEGFGLPGLTAVWMKKISDDPVNRAMLDLGIAPARVERKIRNVELTDAEYDDFARLAGRMAKMRLDVMVVSPDYQRWPAHVKAAAIRAQIEGSREAARGMMMVKSPRIPHDATEELKKRKTGEPVPLMH